VFHVINNGYASTSVGYVLPLPLDKLFGSENNDVREEDFDAAEEEDAVARDGVLDEAEGMLEEVVEPVLPAVLRRRFIAAGLYGSATGGGTTSCSACPDASSQLDSY
jgi:hypothetical protein